MVFRLIKPQFSERMSVCPVLLSWLLPFQIQGCVPFPSCAAPISLRLPSCLPVLWNHCVAAVFVRQSPQKRASLKVLEGAPENWDNSLLRLDVTFGLCPQTLLTSLRSETDKKRHRVTFPHSDVMLVKILSHSSFFSRALECFSAYLKFFGIIIYPIWPDFVLFHRYSTYQEDIIAAKTRHELWGSLVTSSDASIVGAVIERGHQGTFILPGVIREQL